jgi:uncharacterized protein (TIGR00290 family)
VYIRLPFASGFSVKKNRKLVASRVSRPTILKLLAAVVFVLVALLAYAAMRPSTFTVKRSTHINAAAGKIVPLIDDFHNWPKWAPQDREDAAMKRTFGGASQSSEASAARDEAPRYHRGMKRVLLSWSSGKDSAWTLHVMRKRGDVEIVGLLTTLNSEFDRVAMHGTRRAVLEGQAAAAGLPLWVIPLPWPCSNEVYEQRMADACRRAINEGVEAIAFGDLFLADVRAYREKQLAGTGLEPLFPLWEIPTDKLAREMITGGLRTKIVCVDTKQLDASFAGREFNHDLLSSFPAHIDPCGERGEFHTCVYAGPMFERAIELEAGEVVNRDGFVFADFVPAGGPAVNRAS